MTSVCMLYVDAMVASSYLSLYAAKLLKGENQSTEKINIFFDTVYHTNAYYTAQLLFAICKHNNRFLLSELKRYLIR